MLGMHVPLVKLGGAAIFLNGLIVMRLHVFVDDLELVVCQNRSCANKNYRPRISLTALKATSTLQISKLSFTASRYDLRWEGYS
jgi:hypothetical protein